MLDDENVNSWRGLDWLYFITFSLSLYIFVSSSRQPKHQILLSVIHAHYLYVLPMRSPPSYINIFIFLSLLLDSSNMGGVDMPWFIRAAYGTRGCVVRWGWGVGGGSRRKWRGWNDGGIQLGWRTSMIYNMGEVCQGGFGTGRQT